MANGGFEDRSFSGADGLRLYFRDYASVSGDAAPPVLCLHGLTRNSRDFHPLASHLARHRRVIVPDCRGRGRSAYDSNWRNYHPAQYVSDTLCLLEQHAASEVVVVGTSLGGWMSMLLATERPDLVTAVVMNDIGPEAHPEGLARVVASAGRLDTVSSFDEAVAQTRGCYAIAFPDWDDEKWAWYTRSTYQQTSTGQFDLNFDRNIGTASRAGVSGLSVDPWHLFDGLANIPTLLIHGELSDILTVDIIARMQQRKSDLQIATIPNRGHAPLLDEPEAIHAITRFVST